MNEKEKVLKLHLNAGKATAVPPLGPILSKYGINPNTFCKEYNEATKKNIGKIIPIKLSLFNDKTYLINYLTPPISKLILELSDVKKGSSNKSIVGYITETDLEYIYNLKKEEFNSSDLNKVKAMIIGTAKNMGITLK